MVIYNVVIRTFNKVLKESQLFTVQGYGVQYKDMGYGTRIWGTRI